MARKKAVRTGATISGGAPCPWPGNVVLVASVLRGRIGHVAVWTGSQMLIWGGNAVTPGDH